jgi:triacylglycerol lipase
MGNRDAIILVPGLFGFSRIGSIDYFDQATPLLTAATGIADVRSLETPPTGPLWRRVDALHQAVRECIREGAGKVHLVGHSTGGVDIRLLATSTYLWPGGPEGGDRVSFFDQLGSLVSLSAPHKGTPIARRLRGAQENVIPVLFFVSIAAKYAAHDAGMFKALRELWGQAELPFRLAAATVDDLFGRRLTKFVPGLSDRTAAELHHFLNEIVDDHSLIQELTPYAMTRLNRSAVPRSDDPALALKNFVTVAPPPGPHWDDFRLVNGLDPARRVIYSLSYAEASFAAGDFGSLPAAHWIGSEPEGLATHAETAQDGVVPAASQSLDGRAEGLVFGDHLDVVGHYPGPEHGGITVFDSGASFDDARMSALWSAIGDRIDGGGLTRRSG